MNREKGKNKGSWSEGLNETRRQERAASTLVSHYSLLEGIEYFAVLHDA